MNKRNLFEEMMQGINEMSAQREEKTMFARTKKVDAVSIMRATSSANEYIQQLRKKLEAIDNHIKGEDDKCKYCTYVNNSRIGGAAITQTNCGICDASMQFSSTAVDMVCRACAKENQLCRCCGADVELKNRRKRYPFQEKKEDV